MSRVLQAPREISRQVLTAPRYFHLTHDFFQCNGMLQGGFGMKKALRVLEQIVSGKRGRREDPTSERQPEGYAICSIAVIRQPVLLSLNP